MNSGNIKTGFHLVVLLQASGLRGSNYLSCVSPSTGRLEVRAHSGVVEELVCGCRKKQVEERQLEIPTSCFPPKSPFLCSRCAMSSRNCTDTYD